jgi:hypothetical protein
VEYFTPIVDDDNDDNDDNDGIDFVASKIAFVPLDFEISHVVTSGPQAMARILSFSVAGFVAFIVSIR